MSIQTRRILLIHPHDVIEEMMQLCLETIPDCEVITVNSGFEALEKASAEQIGAILLDLDETMPDLCWKDICQNLTQNPLTNSIPLILLTATPRSQELLEFQQTKKIKAIAKTFNLLNLTTQVSRLLKWN